MSYLECEDGEEKSAEAVSLTNGLQNVLTHRFIMLPRLQQTTMYWQLNVVDCTEKRIYHYDSEGERGMQSMNLVPRFLMYVEKTGNNSQVTFDSFKFALTRKDIPIQTNQHDCRVFLLIYAECVARDIPFNFDESSMKVRRMQTAHTLLTSY